MTTIATTANALTIADNSIRQDADGFFCLNDLHRAAGGSAKDQPSNFLARAETDDLRYEVKLTLGFPGVKTSPGRYGGTYVVKELVYAYAMWISPKFYLQVIRAYDALVAAPQAPALKARGTLREALLLALAQEEKIEALNAEKLALEHTVAVVAIVRLEWVVLGENDAEVVGAAALE